MTEKFGPNVAEAGSLLANKFGEEAKAKRNEAAIALEEAEKAKAENNNETNRALVKQARDNFETASREAKEWETGGSQRLVIDSSIKCYQHRFSRQTGSGGGGFRIIACGK